MDRELVANGGLVPNVTILGTNTAEAQSSAYKAVDKVNFKSGFCRRDIGWSKVERARRWCISRIPATTTVKRTEKGY
ncbi:phosphoribosylglycinamide synthetase C domain-containing protein [Parasphingorhabdus sp.]|uniref:phosphoribosylglycinamide synthetase C domain-containing protein n=1 Tax=Parasphingorhabdus sp. TaxID=2709688 RepID=UPI003C73D44A